MPPKRARVYSGISGDIDTNIANYFDIEPLADPGTEEKQTYLDLTDAELDKIDDGVVQDMLFEDTPHARKKKKGDESGYAVKLDEIDLQKLDSKRLQDYQKKLQKKPKKHGIGVKKFTNVKIVSVPGETYKILKVKSSKSGKSSSNRRRKKTKKRKTKKRGKKHRKTRKRRKTKSRL